MASDGDDPGDYIRDYNEFEKLVNPPHELRLHP